MDNTEPRAADDFAGTPRPSMDAAASPAPAWEAGLELGYEAACPWLEQPYWVETVMHLSHGAADR